MDLDVERALAARTCAEWDASVICPRFGFSEPAAYYARSAGSRLGELSVPALVVSAKHDPMVPPSTMHPVLDGLNGHAGATIQVRLTERGGHVAFPPSLDLGLGGPSPAGGTEQQIVRWLVARGSTERAR